jgi:hypothetical protein
MVTPMLAAIPMPESRPKDAILMCGGCQAPTKHKFERHVRVGEYGAYAQIFGCSRCNAERRFGLQI